MKTFILALGWWNLVGSFLMLGFLNESFGRKMLNEWTKIFANEFRLEYWSRLWLFWAAGMNIFFGLINIMAAAWDFTPLTRFLVLSDLVSYAAFLALAVRARVKGQLGIGGYSVLVIFTGWLLWGVSTLVAR